MTHGLIKDLLFAVVALGLAGIWLALRLESQLKALAVVSVLQVFLPELRFFDGVLVLIALTCLQRTRTHHYVPAALLLIALGLWSAISLLWAPSPSGGRSDIAFFLLTGGTIALGYCAYEADVDFTAVIRTWVIAACLQTGLVLLFRFNHSAALHFLTSGVAKLVVNPGSLSTLLTTGHNNVLSPTKSGGLFLNANAGSVMSGVATVMSVYLAVRLRQGRWWLIAAVDAGAVVASGSKTGQILLPISLLIAWALWRNRPVARWVLPLTLMVVVSILILGAQPPAVSVNSLDARQFLWSQARAAISSSPFLGLGYGGWDLRESPYFPFVGSASYPPHNLFLNTWLASGIVGLALLLLFLWETWRVALRGPDRALGTATAVAFAWTVIHSMGDNTSIFGDSHTSVLLGLAVGYLAASYDWQVVISPADARIATDMQIRSEGAGSVAAVEHLEPRIRATRPKRVPPRGWPRP